MSMHPSINALNAEVTRREMLARAEAARLARIARGPRPSWRALLRGRLRAALPLPAAVTPRPAVSGAVADNAGQAV